MASCCLWKALRSSGAESEEKERERHEEGDGWRSFMDSSMVGNPFSIKLRRIK